jgi:hypothetical protein
MARAIRRVLRRHRREAEGIELAGYGHWADGLSTSFQQSSPTRARAQGTPASSRTSSRCGLCIPLRATAPRHRLRQRDDRPSCPRDVPPARGHRDSRMSRVTAPGRGPVLPTRNGTSRALGATDGYMGSRAAPSGVRETKKARSLTEPSLLRVCWIDISSSSDELRGTDSLAGARCFQGVFAANGSVSGLKMCRAPTSFRELCRGD